MEISKREGFSDNQYGNGALMYKHIRYLLCCLFLIPLHLTMHQLSALDNTDISLDKTSYTYPHTPKYPIVDQYHGICVTDHYRWLEDPSSEETISWVNEQNDLTKKFLESSPVREKIRERITQLFNYEQYSLDGKYGEYYFYWKNNGSQNHSVLYRAKALTTTPILVIDPNTLSQNNTTAVTKIAISPDGSHIAYSIAEKGSDHVKTKILHVNSSREYPEILATDAPSQVFWERDNSGFCYYQFLHSQKSNGWFMHILGTDPKEDKPVDISRNKSLSTTDDGRYLLRKTDLGNDNYRIDYRDLNTQEPFKTLLDTSKTPGDYTSIGNVGPVFYALIRTQNPHGFIGIVDTSRDNQAQIIIPETDAVIRSATILNNQLIVHFRQGPLSVLSRYTLDGTFLSDITLPTIGSAVGDIINSELFIDFSSIVYPTTVFRYSPTHNTLLKEWDIQSPFDHTNYETRQIFYQSKDGTKIPMLITHKKNITLDGNNPTLLYGYGGFNRNNEPSFDPGIIHWLEQGGVYASANIRGGCEYGEAWHKAGLREKRQNTFDDFITAAEWLISNHYTNPSKLGINGVSNGGLLVATCMQQRPELFGAVVSEVPVTDMLRFHLFTCGFEWVSEYGDINNAYDFKALYAYSPLHNVKAGITYPPLLVTTADNDDRVVSLHAKKWVARLQGVSDGKNPILLLHEADAGHGGGKPLSKRIDALTNKYTFLYKALNVELK